VNEKRIQEVIVVERRAQELLAAAQRESEQLPAEAEREAEELTVKGRAEAESEARNILAQAQTDRSSQAVVSEVEERIRQTAKLAAKNSDLAVKYVLERVIGRA
jgi:vacuolar-type H+-ATPase subunit H